MALIKCHECGNSVSDRAVACPNCGAPVIARILRLRKAYWIRLAISLVFIAIVMFFVFRLVNKLKKDSSLPSKTQTTE
jgi:large-conductance mechanosensitive channel